MPSGGVRLSGGPVLSEAEVSSLQESDASSVITISDRFGPSETEEEDELHDKQKYRLPDPGKTRLHLRTKEPLSPSPRPVPPPPLSRTTTGSTPSTPQAMDPNMQWQGPFRGGHTNASSENVSDSEFHSSGLSRAGSIYTLGRASLQGQLAHLTSLKLPDAESLAKRISDMPASTEAAKALSDAADQIRLWIAKATDVLNGLNAEDDVEWAAAGGRDGIDDVDGAINKFQRLVDVYLLSIEELQIRDDVSLLPAEDLTANVKQMEDVLASWQRIKDTLKGVKDQVEIAMEWEELWNSVLGEVAQEMDALNRLVFEMEERRHEGTGNLLSSKDGIDLHELGTIVEERPGQGAPLNRHRMSLRSASPGSPLPAGAVQDEREDSSLLALFARMQPLRASLDFLPMRLDSFSIRGKAIFPSACNDLESRQQYLENAWKSLEADAESLRRELGEDRWILVFRNAGRQALKMEESITRTYKKLRDAVDASEQGLNASSFAQKVENYNAKKTHYGPAIERVLAIIDRGVKDRLTVNGEILRLQEDMKQRWTGLQDEMREMDVTLEDICAENPDKQLRDSVSTVLSSERSITSSMVDTPRSSPASSIMGRSRQSSLQGARTPLSLSNPKARKRSSSRLGRSSIPRRIPLTQHGEFDHSPSPSPLTTRSSSTTLLNEASASTRPRWMMAKKVENRDFKPLSAFEPSPYAKPAVVKQTNFLRASSAQNPWPLPHSTRSPSSLGRNITTPNPTRAEPSTHAKAPSTVPRIAVTTYGARKSSLPVPVSTPARQTGSRSASALAHQNPPSTQRTPLSLPVNGKRGSIHPQPTPVTDGNEADNESPLHHRGRPSSALATGRRSSMMPLRGSGPSATAGAESNRPKWR